MSGLRTLGEFIVEKQADFPHASGDLSSLLASIRLAAKIVNREINAAGLGDITGAVGTENVQGEDQQKLDVYANDKFKAALEARDQVCGVASEEEDEAVAFNKELNQNAKYVVLMDHLMVLLTSMLTSLSVLSSLFIAVFHLLAHQRQKKISFSLVISKLPLVT